ncbi:MAG: DUF2062 domain-containing protein [Planctomycetota bacterium]
MRDFYPVRWFRLQWGKRFRRVARSRATPHAIALGAALGVFVAMTPTIGLQMLIAAILATLLGGNRLAAILPVWITNPFTIVPVFTFNYWIGRLLVDGPTLHEFNLEIQHLRDLLLSGGFGKATGATFALGMDLLIPLWLGSVLVGLACALPAYSLVKRAVGTFRDRLHHKRAKRHKRVLEWLHLTRPKKTEPGPKD